LLFGLLMAGQRLPIAYPSAEKFSG